jgi:hypothetical protein
MAKRSLAGRSLLHPDIAHGIARAMDTKMACDAIDKHWDRVYARSSSTGAHSGVRNKQTRRYMPTAHDLAQNNPILRDLLRRMCK